VKIGAIVEGVQDLPRGDDYDVIFLHNMLHECSFNELETLLSTTTKRLRIGGLVNVLEQARLPAGESNYFVFSAESCRDIFQALGFDVIVSERESYTGIPLYELSGKRTNAGGLGEGRIADLVRRAAQKTIADSVIVYRRSVENRDAVAMAFIAMNIANGLVRLGQS
jgi:hypothetical protein